MSIINPIDIKEKLKDNQTIMGVDYGTKNIGIAISDALLYSASPHTTIKNTKFKEVLTQLNNIIEEKNVGVIVIGMPYNMDGSEGPRCQSTRAFAENLLKANENFNLCFKDERMSTSAVERSMIEGDLSRKRRSQIIDKSAAAFILQGVLDMIANLG
jgi:putative Holliday junction resolvase